MSSELTPLPPVTGEVYKATPTGFLMMLKAANMKAAEGYVLISISALGTESFGVVYRYTGPQTEKRAANLF